MSKNRLTSRYMKRLVVMLTAILLGASIGIRNQDFSAWIDANNIGQESVFMNILFIIILFTPFARVNYQKIKHVQGRLKPTIGIMFLNWILGPLLLYFVAYYLFRDEPYFIVGLVFVSIARSKSDILYLNKTFASDVDYMDGVVALNTLVQVVSYTFLTWIFLCYIPARIDGSSLLGLNFVEISEKVALYLGIPFILGMFARLTLSQAFSRRWYNEVFIKMIARVSYAAVVFLCFSITSLKIMEMQSVFVNLYRIAIPLSLYFIFQYLVSFTFKTITKKRKGDISNLLLTGIIHNFRLALIISITLFGINSLVVEVVMTATLLEFVIILVFSKLTEIIYQRKEEYSTSKVANIK